MEEVYWKTDLKRLMLDDDNVEILSEQPSKAGEVQLKRGGANDVQCSMAL